MITAENRQCHAEMVEADEQNAKAGKPSTFASEPCDGCDKAEAVARLLRSALGEITSLRAHLVSAQATNSAIQEHHHEDLYQAMRTILRGFHEGVFVRSTGNDYRSDWAVQLLPFIRVLSVAQELVGGDQCLGEDCPIHGGPNPEGQR